MNIVRIGLAKLLSKPANTGLSVLLFAIGVAIISLLINVEQSLKDQFNRNLGGIDLVVGAKGSPLQLILSAVFHADTPTGNIPLAEAERISRNPMVKKTIPIALGDNYRGFRIVGTTADYAELYNAELAEGRFFVKSTEVTIGWNVAQKNKLKIGDEFAGVHGFMEHGHTHDDFVYKVTGIMKPANAIIDNIILTPVESVWDVHSDATAKSDDVHHQHNEDCDHDHVPNTDPALAEIMAKIDAGEDISKEEMLLFSKAKNLLAARDHQPSEEITALLVFFNSPVAAVTLPRIINETTNLQAAAPAFEINRLLGLLGFGIDALRLLAWVIIIISGINILVHLLNTLGQSAYEIALIRALGTPRYKIFIMMLSQGFSLAFSGWIVGIGISKLIWLALPSFSGFTFGAIPLLTGHELLLLCYTISVGMAGALVPAVLAYKTNIHATLSRS